jgi:uncharacterized membrane protein YbhN (UPF0104 family)
LIYYLLGRIGFAEAAEKARGLSAATAVVVLLLLLIYAFVASGRWLLVLRGLESNASFGMTTRITFVGAFFNQFLPTSIGADAVRVWECVRSGLDLAKTVDSVLLERACYVLFVSLMAFAGAIAWDWNTARLPTGAISALALAVTGVLAAITALAFVHRVPRRYLPEVVGNVAARLAADTRAVFGDLGRIAAIFVTAVINQSLLAACILLLAQDLGVVLRASDCLALLPAVVLVSSLPISVAGWGVREFAMVTAFGYAGVPAAGALVLSVVLGLMGVLAALPGAFLWARHRKASLQQ